MKKRILVSLENDQLNALKQLSRERGKSVSEMVRDAVEMYTVNMTDNVSERLLKWAAENKERLKKGYKKIDPHLSKKIDKIVYGV